MPVSDGGKDGTSHTYAMAGSDGGGCYNVLELWLNNFDTLRARYGLYIISTLS